MSRVERVPGRKNFVVAGAVVFGLIQIVGQIGSYLWSFWRGPWVPGYVYDGIPEALLLPAVVLESAVFGVVLGALYGLLFSLCQRFIRVPGLYKRGVIFSVALSVLALAFHRRPVGGFALGVTLKTVSTLALIWLASRLESRSSAPGQEGGTP